MTDHRSSIAMPASWEVLTDYNMDELGSSIVLGFQQKFALERMVLDHTRAVVDASMRVINSLGVTSSV
jgi:hypothetical protein